MAETDYKTEVSRYSDEELLSKERSKRRRKTGDVVGTGLSAAAAMASPALWAVAGTSAKSYLDNSSKHKIICKEMKKRGLVPMPEDMGDTLFPILASAGSMFVGRAFGGAAGQGVASQAGTLLQNVSSRAFSSNPKGPKKDKTIKKVCFPLLKTELTLQSKTTPEMVAYTPQRQQLATPSAYIVPPNQAPPATLVYQYFQPTAQYPKGYYAPVTTQTQTQVQPQPQSQPQYQPQYQPQQAYAPQPAYQQPAPVMQQQFQMYQPVPPALAYLQTPSQPQYYSGNPPPGTPNPGIQRAASIYDTAPMYQPTPSRASTFPFL
jgi:hypothetical protein